MRYNLFFIAFFLLTSSLICQHNAYFSKCDWDKVKLDKNYTPLETDTCMVFASVRDYNESEKMFMGHDCNKTKSIHYFKIYFSGNKWTCVPKKNLTEALNGNLKRKVTVFVEGFGYTFLTALDRATVMARQYDLLVIMFDWPTYRPEKKSGENYRITVRESAEVAIPFAVFLDSLNNYKKSHPEAFETASLFMHSMGNLLMKNAIEKSYIQISDTLFNSVILNASCVPQKNHYLWVEKLSFQRSLYITFNNRDRILNGAKLISGFSKQLGQQSKWPFSKNALYIDFSRVLNREHNYFLYPSVLNERPYIKNIYRTILIGQTPDFSDENRFIRKPHKRRVEVFDLNEAQKGGIGISIGG